MIQEVQRTSKSCPLGFLLERAMSWVINVGKIWTGIQGEHE